MRAFAEPGFHPVQTHVQLRPAHVAARRPQTLGAAVILRTPWIPGVALHRSERRPAEATELARMRFAMVEEGAPDPATAVFGQQHGFAEVEDLRRVGTTGGERRAK